MGAMHSPPVHLNGAPCAVCRIGTLLLEYERPTKRPFAHIKRHFRCSECRCVHIDTTNAQFIGDRVQGYEMSHPPVRQGNSRAVKPRRGSPSVLRLSQP